METIKFEACKHLDFEDNYTAKKELIRSDGATKVCWHRPVADESLPKLVQFCKLRGRLNSPDLCLCESMRICSDYEVHTHELSLAKINK